MSAGAGAAFAWLAACTRPSALGTTHPSTHHPPTHPLAGFPVTSKEARKQFYLYSNWSYQVAVFISRSSGTLITIGRRGLWAMPALQCVLLAFFVTVAALRWWAGAPGLRQPQRKRAPAGREVRCGVVPAGGREMSRVTPGCCIRPRFGFCTTQIAP